MKILMTHDWFLTWEKSFAVDEKGKEFRWEDSAEKILWSMLKVNLAALTNTVYF